jgi:hypothetical protein
MTRAIGSLPRSPVKSEHFSIRFQKYCHGLSPSVDAPVKQIQSIRGESKNNGMLRRKIDRHVFFRERNRFDFSNKIIYRLRIEEAMAGGSKEDVRPVSEEQILDKRHIAPNTEELSS